MSYEIAVTDKKRNFGKIYEIAVTDKKRNFGKILLTSSVFKPTYRHYNVNLQQIKVVINL